MRTVHRILLFLVLNVIVSAVTTLLVLDWYRNAHPYPTALPGLTYGDGNQVAATPDVTQIEKTKAVLPPLSQKVIEIQNVFGAGDVNLEVVLIRRVGEGDLPMTGWRLQDEQGNIFIFPDLTLFKDGAVQVFSRSGDNTATALYWKRSKPAWQVGKNVFLVDPLGNVRSTFTIR